ncbi:MAG: perosamine synthetase [Planctomycetaceae bacterium]|nr:perosamine synthetase [Planctomycetaceae bacterium]
MSELAINGGTPTIPDGPPAWPLRDDAVRQAMLAAYEDGDWGRYHGKHVERLTKQLVELHGIDHVLPCCSGTIAVELALRGLKIGDGDEVILAGYDFGANFRCIEAVGARPVLVDIDPATWCLDASRVEEAISTETRAILVSHLHGGLAAMSELRELADKHNLRIVEDACQAQGATIAGRVAGTWGDVGVISFGGSKILTAGRGGAITTPHEEVFQRAKIFNDRGNEAFPLSELQAAVLLPQLERLDERNGLRQQAVQKLLAECGELQGMTPVQLDGAGNAASFYKLAWLYDEQVNAQSRDAFIAAIQAEGVAIDAGFRGFVRRGASRCRRVGDLNHSSRAADQTVLLHHPVLLGSDSDLQLVATAIKKVLKAFAQR